MGFWRKQQITFMLTSKCNLACTYCYMPKVRVEPSHRVIDLEFACAGIRDFFSSSMSRSIRFFSSGEPTQAFKRMKQIWSYAYQLAGNDLHIELETNGYFGDEVADWIEKHVDTLWISCDGPPNIQNSQRPYLTGKRSSDVVLNNVKRFAKHSKGSKIQFGVRATVGNEYVHSQTELIKYFHGLGIKYIAASPIYRSKANPNILSLSLLDFARSFVPAFHKAIELGMHYQTLLIVNFDEEVDYYCQASIPTPRLTTDGYISSCDWAAFGSKKYLDNSLNELVYGYYDKSLQKIIYDEEKLRRIRQRNTQYLAENACKGCRAIKHCAGGCVGKMISETNDLYKASSQWCDAVCYLFDNLPINQGLYPFLHP